MFRIDDIIMNLLRSRQEPSNFSEMLNYLNIRFILTTFIQSKANISIAKFWGPGARVWTF